jgi:hypothetical protein
MPDNAPDRFVQSDSHGLDAGFGPWPFTAEREDVGSDVAQFGWLSIQLVSQPRVARRVVFELRGPIVVSAPAGPFVPASIHLVRQPRMARRVVFELRSPVVVSAPAVPFVPAPVHFTLQAANRASTY